MLPIGSVGSVIEETDSIAQLQKNPAIAVEPFPAIIPNVKFDPHERGDRACRGCPVQPRSVQSANGPIRTHAQINLRHQWKESHVFEKVRHRDRVNAKEMKDPRLASMMEPKAMPFDVKRMVYGGLKVLVEA